MTTIQDEREYLTETLTSYSSAEIEEELIQRMDEGMYDDNKTLKRQIRQMGIDSGHFVPVTQEQLDNVLTSHGKKRCDFRLNKIMYIWSGDMAVS